MFFETIQINETPYNVNADVAPVDQFGFVDLHDAFVNASIPGDLVVDSESYNGVDDPDSLIGRPSDVFDALRRAAYVREREAAAEAKASSPSAENE